MTEKYLTLVHTYIYVHPALVDMACYGSVLTNDEVIFDTSLL